MHLSEFLLSIKLVQICKEVWRIYDMFRQPGENRDIEQAEIFCVLFQELVHTSKCRKIV